MQSLKSSRGSLRRPVFDMAKMQTGAGALRDCLVLDVSDEGVQLYVVGFNVPDEFVLFLSGDDIVEQNKYQVIWQRDREVAARFVGVVRRPGFAPGT